MSETTMSAMNDDDTHESSLQIFELAILLTMIGILSGVLLRYIQIKVSVPIPYTVAVMILGSTKHTLKNMPINI